MLAWLGREPGLKQVELAERLDVEPITACRIVDRLEEAGLVERQRDPDDRRAWRLLLTAKAEPMRQAAARARRGDGARGVRGLATEEIDAMRAELLAHPGQYQCAGELRRVTA